MAKTLILGLGNPILSDDGVGIEVARLIKDALNDRKDVDIIEASVGGLELLDLIVGYDRLIVIDAIKTEQGKLGNLCKLKVNDFRATIHMSSPHSVNFASVIELGRQCEIDIPKDITIYAIEVKDITIFSEQCTPEVKKAIPYIVERIIEDQFL